MAPQERAQPRIERRIFEMWVMAGIRKLRPLRSRNGGEAHADLLERHPPVAKSWRCPLRARGDRVEISAEDDRRGVVPIEIRPVAPNIVRLHFGPGATGPS